MKLLVLISLLFAGVVYNSTLAAIPDNKHTVTFSQTARVSMTKTDSVEFVGLSDVLLRQLDTGSNRVTGSTSICITSFSNTTTITLAADNDNGFMLTEADSGNRIPYQATLLSAPLNNSAACQHGQNFQLNLTVPESMYSTALPGNYTATLSIIIASE